jgi:hypothetical protein
MYLRRKQVETSARFADDASMTSGPFAREAQGRLDMLAALQPNSPNYEG